MGEIILTASTVKRLKQLVNSKKTKKSFNFLRVLCGTTRFKIFLLLSENKDGLTVSAMAKILNASLSRISHQLYILRRHRLVTAKRQNREVLYRLADHRIKFFSHNFVS